MLVYGLDRFSEGVDLDQPEGATDFVDLIAHVCQVHGYTYRLDEDTTTVKRCSIYYGGSHPLKVEVSMRSTSVSEYDYSEFEFGHVYNIDVIAEQKASAYSARDRIRDAYDLCFITLNYGRQLGPSTRRVVANAFLSKGFEQADYLVLNQPDELVDNNKLMDMFVDSWDQLGLLH